MPNAALENPAAGGRRLRLMLVIGNMQAAGAQRVMAQLCNHLAAQGHDTTLVTFAPAGSRSFYEMHGSVRLMPLGRAVEGRLGRALRVTGWISALRRALIQSRPDVVISFIDLANVTTLLAAWGLRIPVIVSERIDPGAYRARLSTLDRWLCRLTYPRATRVVVQTARAAAFFRGYPAAKLVTIPNPVPAASALARPDTPASDGRYRIVAVGRLDRQKGFDLLVESFAGLAARFPQWDVSIFGEGAERDSLLAQIGRHGLSGRVRLMDVTRDIAGELAGSHVMAFPSRYEGFPNALAEAMAAGLPVIAFEDVSGVDDLIVPGESGLLARWGSGDGDAVRSLSDGLAQLLDSAPLRVALAAAASRRVAMFRPEPVLRRWDDLIAAVVRERTP